MADSVSLLTSAYPSDAEEQTWVWRNDNQDYYYDRNEWIRVCVEAEQWHDLSPVAPAQIGTVAVKSNQKSPYSVTVS